MKRCLSLLTSLHPTAAFNKINNLSLHVASSHPEDRKAARNALNSSCWQENGNYKSTIKLISPSSTELACSKQNVPPLQQHAPGYHQKNKRCQTHTWSATAQVTPTRLVTQHESIVFTQLHFQPNMAAHTVELLRHPCYSNTHD